MFDDSLHGLQKGSSFLRTRTIDVYDMMRLQLSHIFSWEDMHSKKGADITMYEGLLSYCAIACVSFKVSGKFIQPLA